MSISYLLDNRTTKQLKEVDVLDVVVLIPGHVIIFYQASILVAISASSSDVRLL